ncbi:hypothetical protein BV898_13785 [Hypsibius exemplaris]|uniref:LRRNT domain-containing protein n=1 Tax=Hypsibius exemplaris TaxID=2072580 RepID=A0A1W0W9M3_HYPEX|nr:hypothetical protein BV898_13785 [Hypsibius exemplaris]
MASTCMLVLFMGLVVCVGRNQARPAASTSSPPPDDYCPLEQCDCTVEFGILDCSDIRWRSLDAIINAFVMGDEKAQEFFGQVRVIGVQGNPLRSLPTLELLVEFLPNLRAILVGDAKNIDCAQINEYRKADIMIQSTECPIEDEPDNVGADNQTDTDSFVSVSTPTTNPPPVLAAPSWTPMTSPSPSIPEVAPSQQIIPTPGPAHWTIFFLNCCFVGILGIIIGACGALLLPFLIRQLLLALRTGCKSKEVKVKMLDASQFPSLIPPKEHSGFQQPGLAKRVF